LLAERLKLGSEVITPGKSIIATLPFPVPAAAKVVGQAHGKPSTTFKMLVAVPEGFDPAKPQKVVVVHSTTDGSGQSTKAAESYLSTALGAGWVVLATDGEFGKPEGIGDNLPFRHALTFSALDTLQGKWPGIKQWRYANAGFSGGCGYASYLAGCMDDEGYTVAGTFLSCGAYSTANWEQRGALKTKPRFRKLPIYYSFGKTDSICKPKHGETVLAGVEAAKYKNLTVNWFEGGHEMRKEDFKAALEIFTKAPAVN
jgi:hypothetical protein